MPEVQLINPPNIETTLVCQCCIQLNLDSGAAGVVLLLQNRNLLLVFPTRHSPTDQVLRTKRAVVQQPQFHCTHQMVCAKASAQFCELAWERKARGELEKNDG